MVLTYLVRFVPVIILLLPLVLQILLQASFCDCNNKNTDTKQKNKGIFGEGFLYHPIGIIVMLRYIYLHKSYM